MGVEGGIQRLAGEREGAVRLDIGLRSGEVQALDAGHAILEPDRHRPLALDGHRLGVPALSGGGDLQSGKLQTPVHPIRTERGTVQGHLAIRDGVEIGRSRGGGADQRFQTFPGHVAQGHLRGDRVLASELGVAASLNGGAGQVGIEVEVDQAAGGVGREGEVAEVLALHGDALRLEIQIDLVREEVRVAGLQRGGAVARELHCSGQFRAHLLHVLKVHQIDVGAHNSKLKIARIEDAGGMVEAGCGFEIGTPRDDLELRHVDAGRQVRDPCVRAVDGLPVIAAAIEDGIEVALGMLHGARKMRSGGKRSLGRDVGSARAARAHARWAALRCWHPRWSDSRPQDGYWRPPGCAIRRNRSPRYT